MESVPVRTKVAVVDKAVAVLRAYRQGETTLEPRAVAERAGISLPTAYRLMQSLAAHGFLEKEGPGYRLGLSLLHLGSQVAQSIDLRRVAVPHLTWLNGKTGENAELHVRRGETRVPVEQVLSSQNLRPFVQIGEAMPLHVGASGSVLLAWLTAAEAAEFGAASVERFGGIGPFDVGALRRRLDHVREQGWADSDGERSHGVAAVSAPVRDLTGDVAGAVVLSGPSVRLTDEARARFASLVVEAARRTSLDAGYAETGSADEIVAEWGGVQ